jgi:hypothetical protein
MAGRWDRGTVISFVVVREKAMWLYNYCIEAGGEEKVSFHAIEGWFENKEVGEPAEADNLPWKALNLGEMGMFW